MEGVEPKDRQVQQQQRRQALAVPLRLRPRRGQLVQARQAGAALGVDDRERIDAAGALPAQPPGEPTRLDVFRGELARRLRARVAAADEDAQLGEALDRWELSLFASEPFRSEQLRESLTALLGGADGLWAATVRGALLLGETARDRADQLERLRALSAGEPAMPSTLDVVRRALVETLLHGDRPALVSALDESLLGLRARPAGFLTAVA